LIAAEVTVHERQSVPIREVKTMKMPKALFDELQIAINAVGGLPANATERQRWNALWCAVDNRFFAVNRLYDAGLKDRHIDTALCEISVIGPRNPVAT
jgi:hypothetical protein